MLMKTRLPLALFLVVAVVGCDRGTKELARSTLADEPVTVVPGVLDLTYTENPGIAFRVDRLVPEPLRRPLVVVAPLLVAAAIATIWARRRARGAEAYAYALILGGAAGNLLDRLLTGRVVDFIHVHYYSVFNVADVAVVAGALLLMIARRRAPLSATNRG